MFTRMVVGWNGSPGSEAALDWALRHGPEVPIVVMNASPRGEDGFDHDQMEAVLGRQTSERLQQVEQRSVIGPADVALAEHLLPGTLLVVGTPSHRRGSRWSLGARLAGRHGGGTVAVIPQRTDGDGLRVVVGVDGSALSSAAVDVAAGEARRLGASLEILHAWHPPSTWTPVFGDTAADLEVFASMHRNVLDEALVRARRLETDCTGRLERGDAVRLLDEAGRSAALLVVASHGYGPLRRFFLGSVSLMLLLDPPCPVLVVTEAPADRAD
ncbi:universal stress protein [Agromyces lapidis]|uniref:Universal stress protein n=1 Tax=Agromyces lapidis TaxID=279574 RepID=A0ABV5STW8_9MICO|nr:universal stress protein [Agromyces lapidis]